MAGLNVFPRGPGRRHWNVLPLLALALLFALLAGGCADKPELGNGANTYTTNPSESRLRIMAVDQELSRQAQAGGLDLAALPPGRLSFPQYQLTGGVEASVHWVVDSEFFFTQIDLYYAEIEPTGDGTFTVLYQLSDVQGRDNSTKLQQMTAGLAAGTTGTGEPASLAIIYNETVRAIVPVTIPLVKGEIRITGLTQAEAEQLTVNFADRAFWFPEEGRESRVKP